MDKLNPVIKPSRVSDELYDRTIGEINRHPMEHGSNYKNCIIHLIDSVSRGYTTPLEAYQAIQEPYFPEYLTVRKSAYQHLL